MPEYLPLPGRACEAHGRVDVRRRKLASHSSSVKAADGLTPEAGERFQEAGFSVRFVLVLDELDSGVS